MSALFPCPYCGHSITKQDAAGFRIIGPDEVDQVTVEKCAALIEARKEGADQFYRHDCDEHADAIRAIGRKA